MKTHSYPSDGLKRQSSGAFTLIETVIAIGVLAVLLTGFMAVFTPATQGIRRSISSEQADRLATSLESELATLRPGQSGTTAFDKAFQWIQEGGNNPESAILIYQYRGNPANIRPDDTPAPMPSITGKPGVNYIVQSMVRRLDDDELKEDLKAIEGSLFYVKPTQLVFDSSNSGWILNNEIFHGGAYKPIAHYKPDGTLEKVTSVDLYKEALIAFSAEFHSVPTNSYTYLNSDAFTTLFNSTTKQPIFTRNLAVRR